MSALANILRKDHCGVMPLARRMLKGTMMDSPAFSLTHSLVDLLGAHDSRAVSADEVHALLGLSTLVSVPAGAADPAEWPCYGRDVFLAEGGALLGIRVRPLHPPEAAAGLGSSTEFRQHFEASYEPLIRTALANGQPVLAWGGWPAPYHRHWGIIERPLDRNGDSGAWFEGRLPGASAAYPVAVVSPPAQVYVVEAIDRGESEPSRLLGAALRHFRAGFGEEIQRRFGVMTGAPAVAYWINSIRSKPGGHVSPAFVRSTSVFSRSIRDSYASAARFLSAIRQAWPACDVRAVDPVAAICNVAAGHLMPLTRDYDAEATMQHAEGRKKLLARLEHLRQLQIDMAAVLDNALGVVST